MLYTMMYGMYSFLVFNMYSGGENMNRKIVRNLVLVSILIVGMATVVGMVTPALAASGMSHTSVRSQMALIPESMPEVLAAHNKYRRAVGVPELQPSNALVDSALQWAKHLAATHRVEHSGPGENIWWGTKGAYSITQRIDAWGAEKRFFIPHRKFPDVSTTGKWQDVGHYTQIIWRNTGVVGCATASDDRFDYFVCQYRPAGNVLGQYPLGHA